MVYDSVREEVVLFGGHFEPTPAVGGGTVLYEQTWMWDGTNWTQRFPATSPSPRKCMLAFDPNAGHVVLFGGSVSGVVFDDTWTWDGTNWTERFPAVSPPLRNLHSLGFDEMRGQVLLLGGQIGYLGGDDQFTNTWAWSPAPPLSACGDATAEPNVLWPPDHKMVSVRIGGLTGQPWNPLRSTSKASHRTNRSTAWAMAIRARTPSSRATRS